MLEKELILGTSGGRLLRFLIDDDNLPVMGRAAQGPQALRMGKQDSIGWGGCWCWSVGQDLRADGIRRRGTPNACRWMPCAWVSGGTLAPSILPVRSEERPPGNPGSGHARTDITCLLTSHDRIAAVPMDSVPRQGRTGPCDRILKPVLRAKPSPKGRLRDIPRRDSAADNQAFLRGGGEGVTCHGPCCD